MTRHVFTIHAIGSLAAFDDYAELLAESARGTPDFELSRAQGRYEIEFPREAASFDSARSPDPPPRTPAIRPRYRPGTTVAAKESSIINAPSSTMTA
ncbi:MAG: hypothetical protein CME06_12105 [Gemmatimonadetes bacterium]|nr:hypothetical protein [Gemmatimonadota bacterium]